MNYKEKKKMAKKMMTAEEISNHIPIFQSKAWLERKKNHNKKPEIGIKIDSPVISPVIPETMPEETSKLVCYSKKGIIIRLSIIVFIIVFWVGVIYLLTKIF